MSTATRRPDAASVDALFDAAARHCEALDEMLVEHARAQLPPSSKLMAQVRDDSANGVGIVNNIDAAVRAELGEGHETAILGAAAQELADVYISMAEEMHVLNTEHVPPTVYRQVSIYICGEGMLHANRALVLVATARRMRAARLVLDAAMRGSVPARRAAESLMRLGEAYSTLSNEGLIGLTVLARDIAEAKAVTREHADRLAAVIDAHPIAA